MLRKYPEVDEDTGPSLADWRGTVTTVALVLDWVSADSTGEVVQSVDVTSSAVLSPSGTVVTATELATVGSVSRCAVISLTVVALGVAGVVKLYPDVLLKPLEFVLTVNSAVVDFMAVVNIVLRTESVFVPASVTVVS